MTAPGLLVLGVAQDGGHPQPGCRQTCCIGPGAGSHLTASVAIVAAGKAWLIDAGPDFPRHLERLTHRGLQLAGIMITHAHIGHYTGLMYLGKEAMNVQSLPVWVAPGCSWFLRSNGPWQRLVTAGNIDLRIIRDAFAIGGVLRIETFPVPHRDEFSETVGFRVSGPSATALYVPDADGWEDWETPIESHLVDVDVALLDGTFFDEHELPDRNQAAISHPTVVASLDRFAALADPGIIRFTHFNHTNPLLDPGSAAAATVRDAGMGVAVEGDVYAL